MALNFRMDTYRENSGRIVIRLSGDFDGSSAWELVHKLREQRGKAELVKLDTRGLKTLVPFGRNVFLAHTGKKRHNADITSFVVCGPYAEDLGGDGLPRAVCTFGVEA